MKVLIVGAGFSGLALAAHLAHDGHDVTVVERRPDKPYSGFVMGLWRNARHAIEPIDDAHVLDHITMNSFSVVHESIREATGMPIATMRYDSLIEHFGHVYLLRHSELHELLRVLVRGPAIRYATTVTHFEEASHGVVARFDDGSEATFDLMVGADGVRSQVRAALFGDEGISTPGVRLWLYLAPAGIVSLDEPTNLYGSGEYVCLLPTSSGCIGVEFLADVPPSTPDPPAERISMLASRYSEFSWLVPDILRSLTDPAQVWRYDIQQVALRQWSHGHVTLLGDAAHAVSPMTTLGCAMALEDAQVLAQELRQIDAVHVEVALARYEARRMRRLKEVRHTSDFLLWWLSMKNHGLVDLRNLAMRFAPSPVLLRDMETIISPRNDI